MNGSCYGFFNYLLRQNKCEEENIEDSFILYEKSEDKLKIEVMKEDNKKKIKEWGKLKKQLDYKYYGTVFEFGSEEEKDLNLCFEIFNGKNRLKLIYLFGFYIKKMVEEEGYESFCIIYHGNNIKNGCLRVPHFHVLCFQN